MLYKEGFWWYNITNVKMDGEVLFMNQIIDFHTHAFPDALAPRAMVKLTETAAGFLSKQMSQ